MAETAEKITLIPLLPGEVSLYEHTTRRFNATVPGGLSVDDLENPDLWVNNAGKMQMGDEVRCLADDMSFVAFGICTFKQGTTAKIKIYSGHELDEVDRSNLEDQASDYFVKLRGPKKWCIIKASNGEVIKEMIPTQILAMQELDDYQKALRS